MSSPRDSTYGLRQGLSLDHLFYVGAEDLVSSQAHVPITFPTELSPQTLSCFLICLFILAIAVLTAVRCDLSKQVYISLMVKAVEKPVLFFSSLLRNL